MTEAPARYDAERLPPNDIAAEEAVIAAALVEPSVIPLMLTIVTAHDFFREKNAWCWEAIQRIAARDGRDAVNQITVSHELGERLKDVGGAAYLSRLVTELPTSVGAEYYAEIVHRTAGYRALITAGSQITQMAYQGGTEAKEVMSRSMALVGAAAQYVIKNSPKPVADYLAVERQPVHKTGVLTDWPRLNYILGTLRPGSMYVVAARPSRGKSSFMVDLAQSAHIKSGRACLIFSLEMSAQQLTDRLLAATTRVDSRSIEHQTLTDEQERKVNLAMGQLAPPGLWIEDKLDNIEEIELQAQAHMLKHPCHMIILDYLQRAFISKRASRYELVTEVSRRTKSMAMKLEVPVIALCQLRRAVGNTEPTLEDLKESGAIEQDADAVIFLHDPAPLPNSMSHEVKCIVGKNRYGPVGDFRMMFYPAFSKFEEVS